MDRHVHIHECDCRTPRLSDTGPDGRALAAIMRKANHGRVGKRSQQSVSQGSCVIGASVVHDDDLGLAWTQLAAFDGGH